MKPEGPAAHGGVQVDDILLELNGRRLDSVRQLEVNVYRQGPGQSVKLKVQRGADVLDLQIETEEQSRELDALADLVDPLQNVVPELGIVGLDITKAVLTLVPELRRPEGVVVAARQANVPYSGPALQTGDAIYAVNRRIVNSVADLRKYLHTLRPGQSAVLQIEREGELIYVAIELD